MEETPQAPAEHALLVRNALEAHTNSTVPEDLLKAIAADIGKEIAAYIEVMYPEAVEAASSTFLLSVRNSIHNEIVNAIRGPKYGETPAQWLKRRTAFRRQWVASYRKMRKQK